jgi:hypothetical protein
MTSGMASGMTSAPRHPAPLTLASIGCRAGGHGEQVLLAASPRHLSFELHTKVCEIGLVVDGAAAVQGAGVLPVHVQPGAAQPQRAQQGGVWASASRPASRPVCQPASQARCFLMQPTQVPARSAASCDTHAAACPASRPLQLTHQSPTCPRKPAAWQGSWRGLRA